MSAAPLDAGEPASIAGRTRNLADLLQTMGDESVHNRLREGVLYVAADYAADTYDRLRALLDQEP